MRALNDLLFSIRQMADGDDRQDPPAAPVDLLLYAPCPVKLVVKEHLDRIIAGYAAEGQELSIHLPMGCTSIDPYDPICWEKDAAKLPSIIGSIGFGDFWRRDFVDNHIRKGVFQAVLPEQVNPLHKEAGMLDPNGAYTLYGVTPYLFMVDTGKLGARPMPRRWEDVLNPCYDKSVVMCGDGDDMADAVILNLFKYFGRDGLAAMAANCKGLMHSSSMVKSVGSNDDAAGAIYIIPAFFAYSTKLPKNISIIWPEDGAAASPLYFLAKKEEQERLAALIRFFTEGFAAIDSAAWFVPIQAPKRNLLPPAARLKWVGWDFVETHDINTLRDSLCHEFRNLVRR